MLENCRIYFFNIFYFIAMYNRALFCFMFYNIVNFSIYLQFAKQRKMHEQYVRMSFMPKWTSCIYLFVYRALS